MNERVHSLEEASARNLSLDRCRYNFIRLEIYHSGVIKVFCCAKMKASETEQTRDNDAKIDVSICLTQSRFDMI